MLRLKRLSIRQRYWLSAAVLAVLLIIAAAHIRMHMITRGDRLIESNLMLLQAAIDNHATDHAALPTSVKELDLAAQHNAGVRDMLARTNVSYRPNVQPPKPQGQGLTHFYELCAPFAQAKPGSGGYDYSPYLYPLGHPAGRHCYQLKVTTYR